MSLIEVIDATKAVIAEDASKAQALFQTTNELIGTAKVEVRVGSGHCFVVDEPESLGGGNAAANPVEYALAALGSCQAITYRYWATQLGIRIDELTVEVDGDLDVRGFFGVDDGVRPGFGAVRVRVRLSGPETAARYKELAHAVDAHCPVLDVFQNPVPVQLELVTTT